MFKIWVPESFSNFPNPDHVFYRNYLYNIFILLDADVWSVHAAIATHATVLVPDELWR